MKAELSIEPEDDDQRNILEKRPQVLMTSSMFNIKEKRIK